MGMVLPPFPDAERVVKALLDPIAHTVTALPPDWTPPLICVQRVGGSDDQITDRPRMEISCYGTDRGAAWDLAEQVRQAVLGAIRTRVDGVLIDNAQTDNPPMQIPYATTTDVRRVQSYYRLAWRRPRRAETSEEST